MSGTILLVDDDRSMGDMLVRALGKKGFVAKHAGSGNEALAAIEKDSFDVVVTDLNMKGIDGIALCRRIVDSQPDIPVIVITAFGTMETAISAIRAGAYDFITKPFEVETLDIALARAIQHRVLREEVRRLREATRNAAPSEDMIGKSPAMERVYDLLSRVADSDVSVLITGETGTGKELVARAIHRQSKRVGQPFVAINCSAVPETLLESELFGHTKGAFTDARGARKGLFQQANGGTLFLDEIGDMPVALQPKLLRVLQERAVRPVGSDQEFPIDVRVLAATHRELETMVEERNFREDLYYRLNVVAVEMPPLRARGNDVLAIAQHYLSEAAQRSNKNVKGISSDAAERLLSYPWPGNVRELVNCMERAVALTRYESITVEDLPAKVRDHKRTQVVVVAENDEELVSMDEVEHRYIAKVMDAVQGNKTRAAEVLGFDRKRLYRKLEKYGLIAGGTGRVSDPGV
jgi:two-component system response regulator HydG